MTTAGLKSDARTSHHSEQKNLPDREIPRAEVEQTLISPEAVVPARSGRRFFMRRYFDARFQQETLVRALVEETAQEQVVITVYMTSKVDKYSRLLKNRWDALWKGGASAPPLIFGAFRRGSRSKNKPK